ATSGNGARIRSQRMAYQGTAHVLQKKTLWFNRRRWWNAYPDASSREDLPAVRSERAHCEGVDAESSKVRLNARAVPRDPDLHLLERQVLVRRRDEVLWRHAGDLGCQFLAVVDRQIVRGDGPELREGSVAEVVLERARFSATELVGPDGLGPKSLELRE